MGSRLEILRVSKPSDRNGIEDTPIESSLMPNQDGMEVSCNQEHDIGFARKCGPPKIGSLVSIGQWERHFQDETLDR